MSKFLHSFSKVSLKPQTLKKKKLKLIRITCHEKMFKHNLLKTKLYHVPPNQRKQSDSARLLDKLSHKIKHLISNISTSYIQHFIEHAQKCTRHTSHESIYSCTDCLTSVVLENETSVTETDFLQEEEAFDVKVVTGLGFRMTRFRDQQ